MDKKFERKMERFKDKKINRDDKLKILRNTGVQKKKLIDKVLLILLLKKISDQRIDILVGTVVNIMKYLPNLSQTVEQIKFVKKVILQKYLRCMTQ